MASEIDKLLEQVRLLSLKDKRRLRRALDRECGESQEAAAEGRKRRRAIKRLRKELAALPVRNPADGLSNRDHDKLLYGGDV